MPGPRINPLRILQLIKIIETTKNNYINNTNTYNFNSFTEMKQFLINYVNTNSNKENYKRSILGELIKINFDVVNRQNELPTIVKIILNLSPTPEYVLNKIATKKFANDIKLILLGQYVSQITEIQLLTLPNINGNVLYYDIMLALLNGFVNGMVLPSQYNVSLKILDDTIVNSLTELLAITHSNANIWKCITNLLELFLCIIDSGIFAYVNIDPLNYSIYMNHNFKRILFADDIINKKSYRIFSSFYPTITNNIDYGNYYKNYKLIDFFNKNNSKFVLPPSVLFMLSIEL